MRTPTLLDRLLSQADQALRVSFADPGKDPANPAADCAEDEFDETERRHAAGLMRVNHAGEVCAQALYQGQALTARNLRIREHMQAASEEEARHLAWCQQRLDELDSATSRLNPLWYAGSFAIGAIAGLAGDRWSLGFVMETERQVEAHLTDHLERLPVGDQRSRAIVRRMVLDEARHSEEARQAGGAELPMPARRLMECTANVMKWLAYRV